MWFQTRQHKTRERRYVSVFSHAQLGLEGKRSRLSKRQIVIAALYLEEQHKWYIETFEWSSNFDCTHKSVCEESSVPQLLMALVSMILEAPISMNKDVKALPM